jgi:hypothetical protein
MALDGVRMPEACLLDRNMLATPYICAAVEGMQLLDQGGMRTYRCPTFPFGGTFLQKFT